MKDLSIVPTEQEVIVEEGEYIFSSTDLSGRITGANATFLKYCGYALEEVMGVQHNLIRHPDMPRVVFWLMWGAIQDGEEFFGYVKNLRKDGGFYWVFAHIFPLHDEEGNVIGYKSNRRAPRRSAVQVIEGLYRQMRLAEEKAGPKKAIEASSAILGRELANRRQSYDEFLATL